MIVYEENFLTEHQSYLEKQEKINAKHKKVFEKIEEPEHEIDLYLKDAGRLLEYEHDSVNALKNNLVFFRKYLNEENKFAKKYICETKGDKKNLNYDEFEIRSHDSLLIED